MSDQDARDSALLTDRHLLLQAPAGSGKTTVLAQRFLAALAQVEEPEQVLAITFTRKAAAEMRERVLAALEGRMSADTPDLQRWAQLREGVLRQAQRCSWALEELPARLRIQTIDSLCHEIARAMPLLGRMHQSLEVVDDARPAFLEAAGQTLRMADEEPELQADADRLLSRLDNDWDRARQLLADLLPGRNRWLQVLAIESPEALGARVAASLHRIVGESLCAMQTAIPAALCEEAAALLRASAAHRRAAGGDDAAEVWLQPGTALADDPAQLLAWQAMASMALKVDGEWRALVNVNHGFPPKESALKQRWKAWRDAMQELPDMQRRLQAVVVLPSPQVEAEEVAALAALARLMMLAAAQLKLEFQRRGQVDHAEVAAVARQALREMGVPTELSVRQTLRVRHLLVDEFQDTSPDQLDLVRELTQGWDDGESRSLFVVGDPMQSIYLFRNSEVGLFLQVRAQGVGATPLQALQLQRNFRSVPALVDWYNAAFGKIFPRSEDIRSSAVTYLRAEAARTAGAGDEPVIQVWPQARAEAGPEAAAIAAEIKRLRERHPQWRIAVLVQTRSLAAPIQAALARAAVPALGVDLVPLAERQVVRDLIAIGQALENAANRSAWLSMLHSPPGGLQLPDLHRLCGEDDPAVMVVERLADPAAWQALDEDARLRLERVAPLLLRAWEGRGRQDAASAIETLWRQLGGWHACRNDTERSAALQFLAAVRAAGEREGPPDGARLQQLADQLRDHGSSAGENPVEILTIHHAKGLEWDVVFVPGLGRKSRGDQPPLLRWLELPAPAGDSDLLLAVRSIGEASASDPLGRYIAGLQSARQDHERVRLVYVAVTRARQMLVLSGHAPWNRKLQQPVPRRRSALDILWPAVGAAFEVMPAGEDAPEQEAAARQNLETPWYRLPAQFVPQATRRELQPLSLAGSAPELAVQPEYDWVGPLARATGTVLHAELERFAVNGMPRATELSQRVPNFIARLRESGISEATAAEAAARVVTCLGRVLEDPRARWMLGAEHNEARSEWRLSGIVDGRLRNAVIDRSFIDDGCRWVIDFKTGTHAGGGLDAFLQAERERYRPQLELYRRLASRTGSEPVRAALYYPWLGEFLEFD